METYSFMKTIGERTNKTRQIYSNWAKSHGINYNIMAVLYTAYLNEDCSQKYICEEWCVPKQTVFSTCQDLIAKGVIELTESAGDKREKCISLTKKGKAFAEPLVRELLEVESRVLVRMGKEEVLRFYELYINYVKCIETEFKNTEV